MMHERLVHSRYRTSLGFILAKSRNAAFRIFEASMVAAARYRARRSHAGFENAHAAQRCARVTPGLCRMFLPHVRSHTIQNGCFISGPSVPLNNTVTRTC